MSTRRARRRALEVRELGLVPYQRGLEIQEDLVRRRRAGEVPDQLLLLEHPHVITLGSSARSEHVLIDPGELERRGVDVFEVGRGGDVTYHGPGQLVGYPILDLKPDRTDLHRYLRDIEEVMIRALARYGLEGTREPGYTGVWVGEGKVAAIGVRISSGWITSHGFALNVATDLRYFESIVPCGIQERPVRSISELLGRAVEVVEVVPEVVRAFGEVFERELHVA